MDKGVLQISFGWLFAIIAGIVIIFLAIYGVTKLIQTENEAIDAEVGEEIGILLNPLETSFESATSTSFTIPAESRIYNECDDYSGFGKQLISISQKSFNKWSETDLQASFANKYIFSEKISEGKNFYVFSKPFEFPFKVSDLIYLSSAENVYCFADAPPDIEEELEELAQANILAENCSEETINVCFSGDCDVNVYYSAGYVEKNGKTMYFETDALMYAAIFSDAEIYECHLKRLMKRVEELAKIYKTKANFVEGYGCESEISGDLANLENLANSFGSSEDLGNFVSILENLDDLNFGEGVCSLW